MNSMLNQVSARVVSNDEVLSYPGAAYFLLQLEAAAIAAAAKPGQFLMLKCGDDCILRRPLSIHGICDGSRIELLYRVTRTTDGTPSGKGMDWLSQQKKGDKVNIIGPLGNGFKVAADTKRLLIVAGGIGIAPLGFLATQILSTGRQVTLLLGARSAANILPENMLPSGITCAITTDDGSSGKKGLVIDILPEYLEGADQIFACGPQAMLEKLAKIPEIQSKPVQVSLEVRMGCGAGACYGCSIRTTHGMKRVCREGPVFDIKDIIWQEVSI
ncbi:MAG: dihydroorotate dehydrogenase electron transfer subunit [Dehalococcoidia bacterium]